MALYHKCDVKNGFAYVLQFFSLISDGLGSVNKKEWNRAMGDNFFYGHLLHKNSCHNQTKGHQFQKVFIRC